MADPIIKGLSGLAPTADGTTVAFTRVTVRGAGLESIAQLAQYPHLQQVDISENQVTDLSPLGTMKYLLSLNASHNAVTEFCDFDPPTGLVSVNLASNAIARLPQGIALLHSTLSVVILDDNAVTELSAFSGMRSLTVLSVRHNAVESLSGFADVPALKELYVSGNRLQSLEGTQALTGIEVLDVANNALVGLEGMADALPLLHELDAANNFMKDVEGVARLAGHPLLRVLALEGNPMATDETYRSRTVFLVPQLASLDDAAVSAEEKVAVVNMYNPPKPVLEYRKHCLDYDTMLGEHLSLPDPLPDPDPDAPAIWSGEIRIGSASSVGSARSQFSQL